MDELSSPKNVTFHLVVLLQVPVLVEFERRLDPPDGMSHGSST